MFLMMKFILFINLFAFLAFNPDVSEVRNMYKQAVLSESAALSLLDDLTEIKKSDDKVLVSYKGALTAITAKYENEIKRKKELFKQGVMMIEYAIEEDPDNIEIRFVRLSVQQNIPKFLKYKKNIEEDKTFILERVNDLDNKDLKTYIQEYILYSKKFTDQEKNVISQN